VIQREPFRWGHGLGQGRMGITHAAHLHRKAADPVARQPEQDAHQEHVDVWPQILGPGESRI